MIFSKCKSAGAAIVGAGLLLSAAPATSATMDIKNFFAELKPLNASGVSGRADFTVDRMENTLTARINVSGLTPNRVHPQHLHGRFESSGCEISAPASSPVAGECLKGPVTRDSTIPTLEENDIDEDGFLETVEGLPAYGPIILNLANPDAGRDNLTFPMADADGTLDFFETYDLGTTDLLFDPLNQIEHEPDALISFLTDRVYVIHGVGVDVTDPTVVDTMFEINSLTDGPEYFPLLPAAADTVTPVPLPAAGLLLAGALGGLGALSARRARRKG